MAYTVQSRTLPDGSTQDGPAAIASILANDKALQDQVLTGLGQGWTYSQSGGTAEEPTTILCTNTTDTNIVLKMALTWASGNITGATFSLSTTGSGGAFDTIGTAATFTYDGSGNLTATTHWGGLFAKTALELLGKYKGTRTLYTAHAAATGTSVHGLGTMSTQAASAVAITGGAIDGTTIGGTTQGAVHGKIFTGKVVALGSISGSTAVDWSAGDYFTVTCGAAGAALTWSNLPASGKAQGITIEVTNPGVATTLFPAAVKWPSASVPTMTASGVDVFEFSCRDNSTVRGAQAMKDSS